MFLRDAKAPGLRVRATAPSTKNPKGLKAYVYEAKLNRQTIRRTIGDVRVWDIEAARTEARRLAVVVRSDKDDPRELERQHDAAAQLHSAMGIAREDKVARARSFLRNFGFFGAPHAAFVFLPEPFGLREAADCGLYAQTLMLAMTAHGVASCPQTSLSFHPAIVRQALGVPAAHKLLLGLSFGYEDPADEANRCRVARAALDQTVRFHR